MSRFNIMRDALSRALERNSQSQVDRRIARKATYARDNLLRKIAQSPNHSEVNKWRNDVEKYNKLIKEHGLRP